MNAESVRERLLSHMEVDPETGCWLWTQHCNVKSRYGIITVDGKQLYVHRVSWSVFKGPIPKGKHIDHVFDKGCRHRHCFWPEHLEPVTQQENNKRRGKSVTVCVHGHKYTSNNTYIRPNGKRYCIECRRIGLRKWYAKQRSN
jgi:hypothetical protein